MNSTNEFNNYLRDTHTTENHNLGFRLLSEKVEDNPPLSCCERISQWWFYHSTPSGDSSYTKNDKHTCCSCLDCCTGNLELKYSKSCCTEDTVFFCICFSVAFL
jgi:hypothetical protein